MMGWNFHRQPGTSSVIVMALDLFFLSRISFSSLTIRKFSKYGSMSDEDQFEESTNGFEYPTEFKKFGTLFWRRQPLHLKLWRIHQNLNLITFHYTIVMHPFNFLALTIAYTTLPI